jgi:hypothetical protein
MSLFPSQLTSRHRAAHSQSSNLRARSLPAHARPGVSANRHVARLRRLVSCCTSGRGAPGVLAHCFRPAFHVPFRPGQRNWFRYGSGEPPVTIALRRCPGQLPSRQTVKQLLTSPVRQTRTPVLERPEAADCLRRPSGRGKIRCLPRHPLLPIESSVSANKPQAIRKRPN